MVISFSVINYVVMRHPRVSGEAFFLLLYFIIFAAHINKQGYWLRPVEIIPNEPDADNADVGRLISHEGDSKSSLE